MFLVLPMNLWRDLQTTDCPSKKIYLRFFSSKILSDICFTAFSFSLKNRTRYWKMIIISEFHVICLLFVLDENWNFLFKISLVNVNKYADSSGNFLVRSVIKYFHCRKSWIHFFHFVLLCLEKCHSCPGSH